MTIGESSRYPFIKIRRLADPEIDDSATIDHATKIINDVFHETERELWRNDPARTNAAEVASWCKRGELYFAFDDQTSGEAKMVGAVKIVLQASGVYEFGALTVVPSYRSHGVGRQLVKFAESSALAQGCSVMELELLMPDAPQSHPWKEFLKQWYHKLGYMDARQISIETTHPHLVPLLMEDLHFLVMRKNLR